MRKLFLLLLFPTLLFAEVEVLKDHFIHEAYLPKEQNSIILQAVPLKPPTDITERVPSNSVHNASWLPGYWSWSKSLDDYVWVSGTWRVAPPGHEWIAGKWKSFDEGWVWLGGFWSPVDEGDLTYINRPPPDPVDENVKNAPSNDYFWIPGHWRYKEEARDFVWFQGRWQEFDQEWQYVPAHYVWREKGYIFIEGLWDWNLADRGTAYPCVNIPKEERQTIAYLPSHILEPSFIVQLYYPYWPDYFVFFHFWNFFHPNFDFGWGVVPPWWAWNEWWAFNGVDLWWLWWWWSHPGFAHPFFIDAVLAAMIEGPPQELIQMMENILPPPIVFDSGVVGVQDLIHAIENVTRRTEPILPSSRAQEREILHEAFPRTKTTSPLLPSGKERLAHPPQKPFFGPFRHDFEKPVERIKTPIYPRATVLRRPPIEVVKPRTPAMRRPQTYTPQHQEESPQTSEPMIETPRQNVAPHRYIPHNNTRVTPSRPEGYPQREHPRTENAWPIKPHYTPPTQSYQPRRAPQTQPTQPEKPRYSPPKTAPHPQYSPPANQPSNTYHKRSSDAQKPTGLYYPKPAAYPRKSPNRETAHQGYKVPPKSDVQMNQQSRDALMLRHRQYERAPGPKPHQDY